MKKLMLFSILLIFLFSLMGCNQGGNPTDSADKEPSPAEATSVPSESPSADVNKRTEGMSLEIFLKAAVADSFGEKTADGKDRLLKVDIYSDNTMIDLVIIADPNDDKSARIKDMAAKGIEFFKYIGSDPEIQSLALVDIRFRDNDTDLKNICSLGFKGETLKTADWESINPDNIKDKADDYFVDPSLTF